MAELRPSRPAVFAGLDVGKSQHHLCALNADGQRLADELVANDEAALRAVLERLLACGGPVLLVVDQPASIGALPVAVARQLGVQVAYLPGLAMRRLADLHPGEGKTDARDAYVIADAARTLPRTLRLVGTDDETLAELGVLAGYDDDLAAETTRLSNRARDLLLSVSPTLERVLGPRISHPAVLAVLAAHPTPETLRAAGRRRLGKIVLPLATAAGRSSGRLRHTLRHDQLLEDPGRAREVVALGSGGFDLIGLDGGQQTTQGVSSSSQVVGVEHVVILPRVMRGIPVDRRLQARRGVAGSSSSTSSSTASVCSR